MQGIERLKSVISADHCRSLGHAGCNSEDADIRRIEEGAKVIKQIDVAFFQWTDQAFHAYQVCDSKLLAGAKKGRKSSGCLRTPDRRLFDMVNDRIGVEKHHCPGHSLLPPVAR